VKSGYILARGMRKCPTFGVVPTNCPQTLSGIRSPHATHLTNQNGLSLPSVINHDESSAEVNPRVTPFNSKASVEIPNPLAEGVGG
jgi:hypothetical protein